MKIVLICQLDYLPLFSQREDMDILWTDDYLGGVNYLKEKDVAAVVIDGRLPFARVLCHYISGKGYPVLYICLNDSPMAIDTAVTAGATDFVVHPVRITEFVFRLHRLAEHKPRSVYSFSDITVNIEKGTVTKAGRLVYLSQMEYRVLLLLVKNRGKIITRQEMQQLLWEESNNYMDRNTLTVYIKRLREKLGDDTTHPQLIRTIRGIGYCLG